MRNRLLKGSWFKGAQGDTLHRKKLYAHRTLCGFTIIKNWSLVRGVSKLPKCKRCAA